MNSRRLWGATQAVLGAAGLLAPGSVATICAGKDARVPNFVVRILGARMLGQGAFLMMHPTDERVTLGCWVDSLHGASMLAAAVVKPDYRRSALMAASLAAVSVAIGVGVHQ
jgi:hypothetical protein